MLKRKRKFEYEPLVLNDINVPLAKSGLKVIEWEHLEPALRKEIEESLKQVATGREYIK